MGWGTGLPKPAPVNLAAAAETPKSSWEEDDMDRRSLYLAVCILVTAVVVLGYYLYQERHKTSGIDINVSRGGISIETK